MSGFWLLTANRWPGLKRGDFRGWLGSYLKPSMLSRPCRRVIRDAAAQELIEGPAFTGR